MLRKSGFVMLLLALLLAQATPMWAQGASSTVFCGDLDKADCAILQQSKEAMLAITGARIETYTEFELADVPEMVIEGESLDLADALFQISTETTYRFDEEAGQIWSILSTLNENVVSVVMLAAPELFLRVLDGLNAEVHVQVKLSDSVRTAFATNGDGEPPAEMNFLMRLVDSVLYINIQEISQWAGDPGPDIPEDTEWIALDLKKVSKQQMPDSQMDARMVMSMMIGFLAMNRSGDQLVKFYSDLQRLGELDRNLAPKKFIEIERLRDKTVRNQQLAVFATNVEVADLAAWLAKILQKLIAQVEPTSDPEVTLALTMAPTLFQGMKLGILRFIDPESGYLQRRESTFEWDLATLALLAQLAQSQGSNALLVEEQSGAKPQMSLLTDVEYSDINAVEPVEAPTNVFEPPIEELFGNR